MTRKTWGVWVNTSADELTAQWNLSFHNASAMPSAIEQCQGSSSAQAIDYGNVTNNNQQQALKIFDWSAGIGITVNGFEVQPANPDLNFGMKLLKHYPGVTNSFSNHNGIYNGVYGSTSSLYWDACN